jgi:catechol 2,3-dioxygenase-like lactoylglutathione lyase family enzyme
MKLKAVGVATSDMKKAVEFYTVLGFKFPEFKDEDDHLEPINENGSARLMIDKKELVESLIGEKPFASNGSAFALEYDSGKEIDEVVAKLKHSGFNIEKEPWDAFWGQRYAVVVDPDGYKVDLYANL